MIGEHVSMCLAMIMVMRSGAAGFSPAGLSATHRLHSAGKMPAARSTRTRGEFSPGSERTGLMGGLIAAALVQLN